MKQSTKAVLWSALVFPGAGHLYLKKFTTALALIGASCVTLYYLMSGIADRALAISGRIQTGAVAPDIDALSSLVTQQSSAAGMGQLNLAMNVLLILWLIGMIDAYRLGRARDRAQTAERGARQP